MNPAQHNPANHRHNHCSQNGLLVALLVFLFAPCAFSQIECPKMPMQPITQDGAEARWLQKKILDSRVLDSMEDLATWTFTGDGDMALADSPVRDGKHSLRIRSIQNIGKVGGAGEWEDLIATRKFPGEDWTKYNRISIWVYPDVIGAPAISASLVLHNEGSHVLPDPYNEGRDESLILKDHQWNHVVWEITPLARDKVTELEFAYSLPKMLPDPGDQTVLYIDKLELQKVDPDHVEGWDVAPGEIAFSHPGYTTGATKTAIASGLSASEFSVIEQPSGKVVLTKKVHQETTTLGDYAVLDFSELQTPGKYTLQAGSLTTRSFEIGPEAWCESIWKAINFMYSERCGTVIPGIHGICHTDDYTTHGDTRIIVNGGYHDAGDLSATGNTPGMAYGLFSLAERLQQQDVDPQLRARLLEEGIWGLNWILKTRFGDGYRSTGQLISYWTDGIMGDADDRFGQAVNNPEWNFRVAAVEALAARVLKDSHPQLAIRSLKTAEDDWNYAVEGLKTASPPPPVYGAQDELERISFGAIASIDLYRATGDQRYAVEAVQLADMILASQEQTLQPWTIPMTGYFYTSPKREYLFHRFHIGQEEEPIIALAHLCETFPNHPDWMKWYSAIVLHSKYYQQVAAKVDEPYSVLPAAVYKTSEAQLIPQDKNWTPLRAADRDAYVEEVRRGVPLGGEYYLRRFPVWFDFRGNSSVLLSETKALSAAGQLRGDLSAEDLAQQQAQWLLGRNPFSSSIMYGEGYDWEPLYSVRSGQMVGALPVGIETKGYDDAPYWPHQICWTYKEVWTQPVGEWIWLMQDLHGAPVVEGVADATSKQPIEFRDEKTDHVTRVAVNSADGSFRAQIPQGKYIVGQSSAHTALTALPGGVYHLDLRSDRVLDFQLSTETTAANEVKLRVHAVGAGAHTLEIRASNLDMQEIGSQKIELRVGHDSDLIRVGHILTPGTPWVIVVIPDGQLNEHQEISGVAATPK